MKQRAVLAALAAEATLVQDEALIAGKRIARFTGECWTAGQRQAANLHEVSYRACFKPQLPAFFIERFTQPGDTVYDPFSGRGTTAIEAALQGRRVLANDINPVSRILAEPRLSPPDLDALAARLDEIEYANSLRAELDLGMFYHRKTEAEIVSLRDYLCHTRESGCEDSLDAWIRMVATNRLTGHSPGFFSVYTFPPNQAVSQASQRRINERRAQVPEYRDTKALILRKSRQLLRGLAREAAERLARAARLARFLANDAAKTKTIAGNSVRLTVTSPPFLDVVQYAADNWLRCWFNALDAETIAKRITMARTLEAWNASMGAVFRELYRITQPGGLVAFEVGEVQGGRVRLEEHVVPLGLAAGFDCAGIVVNQQAFTKTAHIWGVANNRSGTNSNRIVVLVKPGGA